MAMRGGAVMQGGNVPVGFDPTASVIPLTPHQVNIEGMKGGAETIIDRILANLATIRTRIQDKCTQINDYASASVAEVVQYPCVDALKKIDNAIRVIKSQTAIDNKVIVAINQAVT